MRNWYKRILFLLVVVASMMIPTLAALVIYKHYGLIASVTATLALFYVEAIALTSQFKISDNESE